MTQINPKDIRVGDEIRVRQEHTGGGSTTWEDTVIAVGADGDISTRSFYFGEFYNYHGRTFSLISRPPVSEPTKTGTIVKTSDGLTYIRVPDEVQGLKYNNPWVVLNRPDRSQFTWNSMGWSRIHRDGATVLEIIKP